MKLYVFGFCLLACITTPAQPAKSKISANDSYDILIRGGRIYDGTGNPWFEGDLGIRFDKIVAIGKLSGAKARRVIDAKGMAVSPALLTCWDNQRLPC